MTNTVYNREDLFGNPRNKMTDEELDFCSRCTIGLEKDYCVESGFNEDGEFVIELYCNSNSKLNKRYSFNKDTHKELLGRIAYVASKAV